MTIEHVFLRKSRELLETYTRVLLYRPLQGCQRNASLTDLAPIPRCVTQIILFTLHGVTEVPARTCNVLPI
jgi:hypothetical protein